MLLLVFILPATTFVSAHKPLFEAGNTSGYADAIEISDPEVSSAAYGYLDSAGDIDYYYFDTVAPLNVYTELLVPEKKVYYDFYPSYAIVGPGLAGTSGLPFEVPGGHGALSIDSPSGARETFYEPFTGVNYYRGVRKHTMLDQPGRYYVVVYDRSHSIGDYVLAVGEKESFAITDIPGAIAGIAKIRSGGVDHG